MCTRYYLDESAYETALDQLNISAEERVSAPNRDIYPSETAPVILSAGRDTDLLVVENQVWGFPSAREKGLQVNARAETVLEKPMFSLAARQSRCIIPAKYFYEWDEEKNKATFRSETDEVLYMAGIFEWPVNRNYSRFVIITRPANEAVQPVHDRMPLLLEKEEARDWITNDDMVEELLKKDYVNLFCQREYEQMKLDL